MRRYILILSLVSCGGVDKEYLQLGDKVITRLDYNDKGQITIIEFDSINNLSDTNNFVMCKHFPMLDGFDAFIIKRNDSFVIVQSENYFEKSFNSKVVIEKISNDSDRINYYKRINSVRKFDKDTVFVTNK